MTASIYSASNYLLEDYGHKLFPLATTSFLVQTFADQLKGFIDTKLLDSSVLDIHFLPQQRCYAAKGGFHLRRTVKLDPVAEFFIYDLVYRNRQSFRPDHRENRRSFGYRFFQGKPQSSAEAYAAFKSAVAEAKRNYEFTLTVDVATYFTRFTTMTCCTLCAACGRMSMLKHWVNFCAKSTWDAPSTAYLTAFTLEGSRCRVSEVYR